MMEKSKKESDIRILDAADERQYMIDEEYEVYEKQGAPMGAITFHYHNFYEIIYVLEGRYSSMIENQTYHLIKGDFLLINKDVMHKYHYVEKKHDSSKRIILWVTEQMLEELSNGEMDLSACFHGNGSASCAFHFPIYYEELLQGYLLKMAMTRMQESGDKAAKRVLDRGCLTLFLLYLNLLCSKKEYLFAQEELVSDPLVEQVSDYIETHLSEKITVEMLAEQAHMSKFYFLRKFKELTGVTVHSFVTQKRLIAAGKCLKEGESVMEVCQTCGFSDYSSFLRNFKATFHMSPGQYAKEFRMLQ